MRNNYCRLEYQVVTSSQCYDQSWNFFEKYGSNTVRASTRLHFDLWKLFRILVIFLWFLAFPVLCIWYPRHLHNYSWNLPGCFHRSSLCLDTRWTRVKSDSKFKNLYIYEYVLWTFQILLLYLRGYKKNTNEKNWGWILKIYF